MNQDVTRRQFVKEGSAATAAVLMAAGRAGAARQDEPTLKIGLVGCGGRGTGAAENCLEAAGNVQLIAMGDMSRERLDQSRKQLQNLQGFKVPDENCFTGFDAYQKVIDSGIDLVLLATPPGFRPMHIEAAVDAGKHVFMEKPVAVDPVGVRRVIAAGEKAKQKGLAMVAGTQNRHDPGIQETIRRIHDGQIGKLMSIRCNRLGGYVWLRPRRPEESDMEYQVRNWYYFTWLSGDFIAEMHVHELDLCNWIAGNVPAAAVGAGGRIQRSGPEYGNIYDHMAIEFEYPDGLVCAHFGRQMERCFNRRLLQAVGSEGTADLSTKTITGKNPWKYEKQDRPSTVLEHANLIASIRAGKPLNEARRIAESTLTCILGREACYTGQRIRWDEIMKSDLDLSPPKYEPGPLPVRPVPIPGKA